MSEEILRQPYEISVWNNKQFYLIHNTSNDAYYEVSDIGTLSADEVIVNDYLKEVKQGVIGSDKLDIAYRAFNPKFTSNINGTHKLTFQLSTKYWNEELGQFVFNPWLGMLVNERKIKLKYQGNYYSLIIKQVQESVDTYINTYTCEDIYIEELSKIGYNLEFDTDLENNQGTVKDLADAILVETNWEVDREHSDDIVQYQNEAVYTYSVTSDTTPAIQKKYDESEGKIIDLGSEVTFPANSTIYLSYSDVESKNSLVQCFWVPNDAYETLEDGTITNSNFYFIDYKDDFQNLEISLKYRANKLVESIKSIYVPELEQYCQIYKDKFNKEYYLSTENQYMSSVNIQQLISNNMNFISLNGWSTEEGGNVSSNNGLLDNTFENKIHFKIGPNQKIINSGMYDNRSWFKKGIINGTKLVLVLEGVENKGTNNIKTDFLPTIIFKKAGESEQDSYKVEGQLNENLIFTKNFSNSYFWEFTFNKSIDYDTLVQYGDIQFCFSARGGVSLVDIVVSRILLFEEHLDGSNKIIVPDLGSELTNEVIKKIYYLVDKNLIDTKGRIEYTNSYEDYSILIKTYSPVINETYEKIRSITGEKSNCFNLLQTLCETFECWIKFNIKYDSLGYVTYQYKLTDDPEVIPGKRYYIHFGNGYDHKDFIYAKDPSSTDNLYELIYDKTITFHNYITKFNYAGFRYGINLKSINRKVVTDNLVTKLIVEPNNNEYAPDGFCSIQLSDLNVDGENLLFDFSYYFNNKLLSKDNVYRDLYDDSATGGLGYLKNLADINRDLRGLIIRQNTLTTTLSRAKAKLQGYSALYNNSLILYEKSIEYITNNYKGDINGLDANAVANSELYNDQFVEWIRQRDRYKQSADDNKELVDTYQELVDKYTQELKEVEENLKEKSDQKAVLHKAFNTKYSAYIKEGSWIDEDYIDPDLYYLDALGVLNTSAQPKVEYSISVLELSELDEYKGYTFNVGNETYVEDTEYFGYDSTGKPVQKWVVVSNVEWSLDDPTQNVITVKTYNDQFDSLFQRITAATQSLQFSEGSYRRAATAVNSNGTLNTALLSRSLAENSAIIQNVSDQSVTWGSDGITISSALNGREQVRLVSGGIAITEDGGKTWHTGITGHGINADMITTGQLDTNVINIFAGNSPAFIWNQKGIAAYAFDGEGDDTIVSNSKYVLFSQAGIEGKQNNDTVFKLSYDGFELNAIKGDDFVKIKTDDPNGKVIIAGTNDKQEGIKEKFIVYNNGNVIATNGTFTGTIHATDGDFTGVVHATDGDFTGIIKAQDILLPSKNGFESILNGSKIKNNYLDLGTITIDGVNTKIDLKSGGEINLGGKLKITQNGISFSIEGTDNQLSKVAFTGKYSDLSDPLTLPSYIKATEITQTTIKSPTIIGGRICAASNSDNNYAEMTAGGYFLYMSSGTAKFSYLGNNLIITNSKDQGGITLSCPGAIKIEGGYGIVLRSGENYGSTLPDGIEGRIFFLI